jgi:hypothetical protein
MKSAFLFLVVVGAFHLLAGCNRSGSTGSAGGSSGKSDVSLVVVLNKIEGGEEKTQSGDTIEGPSLAQVEDKFKSLPWTDAQYSPYVGLGRNDPQGVSSVKIRRPINTKGSASMQSIWISREGGTGVERLSEVFDSKEKALALLKAFLAKDAKLSSLATWTKTEG